MLDPALQQYLQQAKTAGMTVEAVTAELVKIGWSNEQVLEAQAWYAGKPAQQSILDTPPPINIVSSDQEPQRRRFSFNWKIVSGAVAALLIFLMLGSGAYAYLLASDKMKSDNQYLEDLADKIAVTVPFFPKTAKIVLQKAMLAHENVTQNSLDFSLVATSSDFESLIGSNQLDLQLVGYTDLSDPKNPKIDVTGDITKDFNFQVKKKDQIAYFKINKLPALLLGMFGVTNDQLQPVIANWISYDTTPLDTEARKTLDELDSEKETERDVAGTMAEKMLSEDVLPALAMEKEQLDGMTTYKINFMPSPLLLDKLGSEVDKLSSSNEEYSRVLGASTYYLAEEPKLSELINDLSITMWIDNKNYYVRKATVSFDVVSNELNQSSMSTTLNNLPLPVEETSPMTVVAVLKLDNFGETLPIDTPTTSITVDEFLAKFYEAMGSGGGLGLNPSGQLSQANNAQREADINAIMNATYQYAADHNNQFPPGIAPGLQSISGGNANICSSLVPDYLARMPMDPAIDPSIFGSSCEKYDTGYTVEFNSATGKLTIAAPLAELGKTISVTR